MRGMVYRQIFHRSEIIPPHIGASTQWNPLDASPPKFESRGTNTTWSPNFHDWMLLFFDVIVTALRIKKTYIQIVIEI